MLAVDNRTGQGEAITVTLEKSQLRAAQTVGESSKELITRLCSRQGYTVQEIGLPDKLTVTLDLDELSRERRMSLDHT